MQTIQISEFKAKCFSLVEAVATTGEVLVVTKNGRPVVEVCPFSGGRVGSPFGFHPRLQVLGDIFSPLDPSDWGCS
jgi:prevent-host-death family protein